MRRKNSKLAAVLALAILVSPAFAAEPCKTAAAPIAQAVAGFDQHSRGIVIFARDGIAESRAESLAASALMRSRAVEAALAGFLVIEYRTDTGKVSIMDEMSEKELAAFDKADISASRLAKIVGDSSSVVVISAEVSRRHAPFGSVEEAVRFFSAV